MFTRCTEKRAHSKELVWSLSSALPFPSPEGTNLTVCYDSFLSSQWQKYVTIPLSLSWTTAFTVIYLTMYIHHRLGLQSSQYRPPFLTYYVWLILNRRWESLQRRGGPAPRVGKASLTCGSVAEFHRKCEWTKGPVLHCPKKPSTTMRRFSILLPISKHWSNVQLQVQLRSWIFNILILFY